MITCKKLNTHLQSLSSTLTQTRNFQLIRNFPICWICTHDFGESAYFRFDESATKFNTFQSIC